MTLKKKPVNEPWREVFLRIRKTETSGLTWVDQLLFKARFMYQTWDSVPNEVFVGQKDINELQRRVKYETNVKDTIHLGQVLKAEKLYVDKKETCFFVDVEFSLPRVHADMSMVFVV